MAYVQPTSNIILLKGVGLPSDYSHTYRFRNRQQQELFFKGFSTPTTIFQYQSYVRVNRNQVKIQHNAKGLYNCDYMMFQNSDDDTDVQRWYYAFIVDVEYVNERTSLITYQIDELQTWYLIADPQYAFVERRHSTTDQIYENTIPESFELGPYVLSNFQVSNLIKKPNVQISGSYNFVGWKPVLMFPLSKTQNIQYVGGTVSMVDYKIFDSVESLHNFLEKTSQEKMAELVYAFMFPSDFIGKSDVPNIYNTVRKTIDRQVMDKNHLPAEWGSWVPKNNKIFTYPYSFFYATNFQGNSATFRFENFSDAKSGAVTFGVEGCLSPNAAFSLTPKKYASTLNYNYNESLYISGTPSVPITIDTYRVWLAQNKNSLGVENLATAISGATSISSGIQSGASSGISSGNAAGAVIGAVAGGVSGTVNAFLNTASFLAKMSDSKTMPDQVKGTPDSSLQYSNDLFDFGIGYMCIKREYARRIDDFWSMYGYPRGRVENINLFRRPTWDFLKCSNLYMTGNIPSTARVTINNIFERGITFWEPGKKLGDYSQNNAGAE